MKKTNAKSGKTQMSGPWVEISLDNLSHNLNLIRKKNPGSPGIMAVVKDNAYGCGAVPVAAALYKENVDIFAVARTDEARALRRGGIISPILVLGEATDTEIRWGSRNQIHFALNDLNTLPRWRRCNVSITFHCKVDTGMGRLGLLPSEIPLLIQNIIKTPRLACAGIFTHFPSADIDDIAPTKRQQGCFKSIVATLLHAGISPRYIHCANSAAALRLPDSFFTFVRPGIALYGCKPDPTGKRGSSLKPILSLKSRIVKIKEVPAGTTISYGGNYITRQHTRIATIPLGYGQGYPRTLTSKTHVLINQHKYPVVGNITMDYIMVDLGLQNPAKIGDEVVAIGTQGRYTITPDDLALAAGTIGYEILCRISPSVERQYIRKGKIVQVVSPYYF